MKILEKMTMALTALALCAACSDEDDVLSGGGTSGSNLTATIPAYQFDGGTRVNISDDLQTFTWSDNDMLGIYYSDASTDAQTGYTVKQGGSSSGEFANDVFYLNPNKNYYAFYPYDSSFTTTSAEVDFTGQKQGANGSAAHLGAYNYMFGSVDINNGAAHIAFNNLGAVIQLQLTLSNAGTYTGVDITSDGTKFTTKGKASMVDGSITATESSKSIHLDFENGITLNEGDVLTANILVAPVDMSDSTLTITLTDVDNNKFEVTTAGKNMLQGKAYLYAETMPFVDVDEISYVTFTADAEQTLQMTKAVSTLEYSVNGGSWTELGTNQVTFGGSNGDLRLRGKATGGTNGSKISFGNATKVACSGDIRTLQNYESYKTITSSGSFNSLFLDCVQLTSAPDLPATKLTSSCYDTMFRGCTSLTQAPELPATTLASKCYFCMFYDTPLTQAPELPATTLAFQCYAHMFQGCSLLTQAPELPATTLASYCYDSMFLGCSSLTQAPDLPATMVVDKCYIYMFQDCKSLTQAPELPATTLASSCYGHMFRNCTSLTQSPVLPATTLASQCYYWMFYGCTSLTQAPELPAAVLKTDCYSYMFSGCSKLNYIKMMATDISATSCLNNWVSRVASSGTFMKDPSMTSLPTGASGIPSGWTVVDYTDSTGPDMSGSDMGGDW